MDSHRYNKDISAEATEDYLYALFSIPSMISGYYIDLNTRHSVAISQEKIYNERYNAGDDWSRIDDYIRECVHPDDQTALTAATRIDFIRDIVTKEQQYSIEIRDLAGGKERWFRYSVIRCKDKDHAAIVFRDISKTVWRRQELERLNNDLEENQAQLEESTAEQEAQLEEITALNDEMQTAQESLAKALRIADALSSSYLNVYLVNTEDKTVIVRKLNGYVTSGLSKENAGPYPYQATCNAYIDNRVYEEDKQMVREYMKLENIIHQLSDKKEYEYTYRVFEDGDIHYYQGRYVLVDDRHIICGFQTIDDIVAAEKARTLELEKARKEAEEERQRVADAYGMIYGLSQEYHTIWVVSKETSRMRLIRSSGVSTIKDAVQMGKDYPEFDTGFDKYINTYVEPEDRERMHREIAFAEILRQLENKSLYSVNYLRRDVNGKVGYHQIAFSNADTNTGVKQFVYGFRDIDKIVKEEQTQKEELRKAKEAADAANNAKTSFLFNMSHDIRTPMNAIIGFRDMLEKHQDDPVKRQDYLNKIQDASSVLLSIINNVLEMARIEKGSLQLDETAWGAEQFNDTLYSVFKDMMEQKNITFTRQIDVQHSFVFGDPIKLREIFINILSNAYKYTNPGGTVSMHLEEVPCDREGWVLYRTTISDTGIGMSDDFLPHLFEEFSRENNTTDAKIEGTGLGMPIVKRLVEMLDGTIEVSSVKGKGTTFTVTLPHRLADKGDIFEHVDVQINPKAIEGKRVLLTEDNDLNAEITTDALEEAGLKVERAENGRICCQMLTDAADDYYDMILMDIQMPEMNGFEATKVIRRMKDNNKALIPIIAMTANAFEEDKRAALKAGMNGHIAKPIRAKALIKAVAGVLRR